MLKDSWCGGSNIGQRTYLFTWPMYTVIRTGGAAHDLLLAWWYGMLLTYYSKELMKLNSICVSSHGSHICLYIYKYLTNLNLNVATQMTVPDLPPSWPAGHICPTYKESFQVRWDNSIPLFLHAAIYHEVSLFRWTSQNAFSRETAAVWRENAFWLVQRNRDTSR